MPRTPGLSAALAVLVTLALPLAARAQTAGDFRSVASGDWSAPATWERFDGVAWLPAGSAPSAGGAGAVVVRAPHDLTLAIAANTDQTTIEGGASLEVLAGGSLVVGDGVGSDLEVFGTLGNAGSITQPTGGTISFEDGARYAHRHAGVAGTIPTALWDPGSLCEMAGYTSNTTPPSNLGQAFGTFAWNCPAQTGAINLGGALTTINGHLRVLSTGTGSLRLAGNGSFTTNVAGDFVQDAGTFVLTSATGNIVLQVNGDLLQSLGTLDLQLAGAGGQAELRVRGRVALGGTLKRSGSATPKLVLNGPGITQTLGSTGPFGAGVWLEVAPGATVRMGTNILMAPFTTTTVAGALDGGIGTLSVHTLTVANGGTLRLGAGGLTQSGTGTVNVQTGGRLEALGRPINMAASLSAAMNVAGTLLLQGGTMSFAGGANPVNVSNGGVLDLGSGVITLGSGAMNVFAGGTLRCGTGVVDAVGAASFFLNAGGTLATANPAGLSIVGASGSVQTPVRSFSTGARYVFDGATVQITGTGLPATVRSLRVASGDSVIALTGVTADSGVVVASGALVTDGITLTSRTPLRVDAGGALVNNSAGTLVLGAGLVNDGTVSLNGSGPGCGDFDAMRVRSETAGIPQPWSGAGSFELFDVDVQDQSCAPGLVTVRDGTDAGGNSGWTFSGCTADAPVLAGATLALSAPAPNPARGTTRVRLTLPREGRVSLELLDVTGRRVRTHDRGTLDAGTHDVTLDLRGLAPGVYRVRMTHGGIAQARALVVTR